MDKYETDVVVIGGGVIGFSIASKIAPNLQTILLEGSQFPFNGTSSRNSEVIHAGIYYKKSSLKLKHCLLGRELLLKRIDKFNIGYEKVGKLIIARLDSEIPRLDGIQDNYFNNTGLLLEDVSLKELSKTEPSIKAMHALHSPHTAIFDSHELFQSYAFECAENGVTVASMHKAITIERSGRRFDVVVEMHGERFVISAKSCVVANGLGLEELFNNTPLLNESYNLKFKYAKGNNFKYAHKNLTSKLIYPIPEKGGLGIHLTKSLDGEIKFGPDVEWLDAFGAETNFAVNEGRAESFAAFLKSYIRDFDIQKLSADYSGIRPKVALDDNGGDFIIDSPTCGDCSGLTLLAGIESPGLTCAESIGEEIARQINKRLT